MHERNSDGSSRYTVRAVRRATSILQALSASEEGLTLENVCAQTRLKKHTAYRILLTLEEEGFVERTSKPVRYTMGLHSLVLGLRTTSNMPRMGRTQAVLDAVSSTTGETVGLYVRWGKETICVARAMSIHPLQYRAEVGGTASLCAGSPGKLLLAQIPPDEAEMLIHETLPSIPKYPGTITQVGILLRQLEEIRELGFAISKSEMNTAGVGLAVPVFDGNGRVVAAVSLVGPSDRIPDNRIPELIGALKQGSKQLSLLTMSDDDPMHAGV